MADRVSSDNSPRGTTESSSRLSLFWVCVTGVLFSASLLWGLLVFGATEPHQLYRLFLLVMVSLLACLWGVTQKDELRQPGTWILLAVGAFLLAQIAVQGSLEGRGYVLLALGWSGLIITRSLSRYSRRSARFLVMGFIAIGALEGLHGLVQSIGGVDYIGSFARNMGRIATGTLYNRNHFAGLLNMTILLAMGGLFASYGERASRTRLRSEQAAWAWIILLSCSFMGLAILLSQSRAGTITFALSLIFVAFLLKLRKRGRAGTNLSALAAWILMVTVLVLGLWVGLDSLLSRFGDADTSLQNRTVVYKDSLKLIADNPLFGVGAGMYQWRFRPYQSIDGRLWFDYAHNDYLQTAAEWGIPLALLFWAFVVYRLLKAILLFLRARDPWKAGIALGCAGSIFTILLHSLVDFNLYIPANLIVFCSILGLAWGLDREPSTKVPLTSS